MPLIPDLNRPLPRLMFITDTARTGERELLKVVELVLKGGCRLIQVRAPELNDRDFYFLARSITAMANAAGAVAIINDRIDLCHAVGAQGVHLGAGDLPLRVARQLLGPEKLLGYSAHTPRELRKVAEEGADYVTFSPIFTMAHKDSPHEPWGPEGYREALLASSIPVFALGGITLEGAHALVDAGGAKEHPVRIAVASLLSEASEIKDTTAQVIAALHPGEPDLTVGAEARYTFEPDAILEDWDVAPGADVFAAEDQD